MSALKYWLWLAELRGLNNQTRLALLAILEPRRTCFTPTPGNFC